MSTTHDAERWRLDGDEPLECVVVRSGEGPMVVNLDLTPVEAPETVQGVDDVHPAPTR
jgi:uncharacterized RmlC-like cupin family protein